MQATGVRSIVQRALSILSATVLIWQASAAPALAVAESTVLSLPELLSEARRANPALLEARKRWEAAQQRVPLSKALPAPTIGVEFEEIPRGGVKLNTASIMYQLIQALPFPGKLSARHKVAVKEAQVAAMTFKRAEWDLMTDVKAVYYDLYLLDRETETQQEQVVWLEQAVNAAQARYATGAGSQPELLKLQGELLGASNTLRTLSHRRQAMEAHLNHLLNRSAHEPVGHPGSIPLLSLALTPDELVLVAQEQQPELLAVKFASERADASYRLAKRELLPDLETMFELRDPAMGPVGPWDLTLAIAIPVWFWTKWRYGLKSALYDKESMEAAYAAMRNDVTRRVHEHWHEALASYTTAKLCQDGLIELSRQAVKSAEAGYQSGRASSAELLDALRGLSEQRRTYYQHLVMLEQHVGMLEQAGGWPVRSAHAGGADQ